MCGYECDKCQLNLHSLPAAPIYVSLWMGQIFMKVYSCTLCWTILRKVFLMVVDAHSKWMKIKMVSYATSQVTNEHLKTILARLLTMAFVVILQISWQTMDRPHTYVRTCYHYITNHLMGSLNKLYKVLSLESRNIDRCTS